MANLSISLLGPVGVSVDGQRLEKFRTNKALALLIYLMAEATRRTQTADITTPAEYAPLHHRRDALMSLFWPDMPQSSAQANLRQTLFQLRQAIPQVNTKGDFHSGDKTEPLLVTDRQTVQLNPAICYELDVATFTVHFANYQAHHPENDGSICQDCQQQLEQAVELYRADFLVDFYLPDSEPFETWAQIQREQLRNQALEALHTLASTYLQQHQGNQAQTMARRQLEIDNMRESAHRQLMTALAQNGQRSEALAHYEQCRQLLTTELGIEPSTETRALYEAIRSGGLDVAGPQPSSETTTVSDTQSAPFPVALPAQPDRQAQLILRDKVKTFWIEGVLEQSLHGAALIELGKEVRSEAVAYPWEMVLQRPAQPHQALPADKRIIDVFDKAGGALLILGEPGGGKTTMLLDLARALITRTTHDPHHPVPVVINLASWSGKYASLDGWLVQELNEKYLIPKKIAQTWIDNDQLLLLLDGLDEVRSERQSACVSAINQFRQDHGLTQLAVCSRLTEYEALTEPLRLEQAVVLQPLAPDQIHAYLEAGGPSLAAIRSALETDAILQSLARSPLMLSIMMLAYQEASIDTLAQLDSTAARQQHLFAAYVEQMLRRRGNQMRYQPDQMRQILSWLAQQMSQHSQRIFLIEGLQPDWLTTRLGRRAFSLIVSIINQMLFAILSVIPFVGTLVPLSMAQFLPPELLAIFLASLATGIIGMIRDEARFNAPEDQRATKPAWHVIVLLVGGVGLLTSGLVWIIFSLWSIALADFGIIIIMNTFSLCFGTVLAELNRINDRPIQTNEAFSWSWRRASQWAVYFGLFWVGVELILTSFIADTGPEIGRLVSGTLFGGLLGMFWGGFRPAVLPLKSVPNQGMRLSLRNAILIATLVILTSWGFASLTDFVFGTFNAKPSFSWRDVLVANGQLAIPFGLMAGLFFGGVSVILHVILRLLLWTEGHVPLNLRHFLDHATGLIFMRKVGGGYIFAHQLLQDYFANNPSSAGQRVESAD